MTLQMLYYHVCINQLSSLQDLKGQYIENRHGPCDFGKECT